MRPFRAQCPGSFVPPRIAALQLADDLFAGSRRRGAAIADGPAIERAQVRELTAQVLDLGPELGGLPLWREQLAQLLADGPRQGRPQVVREGQQQQGRKLGRQRGRDELGDAAVDGRIVQRREQRVRGRPVLGQRELAADEGQR